jgi:hypothetical protein
VSVVTAGAPHVMRHLVCALFLGLCVSSIALTADFTPEEQAVWQMEEAYWR